MNEIASAANRSITLLFDGMAVDVRQVQMLEFDQFVMPASKIRPALLALKEPDGTAIARAFLEFPAEASQLILLLTSLNAGQIPELTKDLGQITSVLHALYQANAVYFDEKPKPKRASQQAKKDNSTWFDDLQFLISCGHQHSEIMQYTYGAFVGYQLAASRDYRRSLRVNASMIRTANHATEQGIKKYLRELSKDD